jgi:hypothetical protein
MHLFIGIYIFLANFKMKMTLADIHDIIKKMLSDNYDLIEWDDFVSILHKDDLTKYWSNRCNKIEQQYSDLNNNQFLTESGWKELQKIEKEISLLLADATTR